MIKVMLISHILLSVSVNGAGDSFNMVAKNDGLELERGRLYTKWTKEAETSDHQIKEDNHGVFQLFEISNQIHSLGFFWWQKWTRIFESFWFYLLKKPSNLISNPEHFPGIMGSSRWVPPPETRAIGTGPTSYGSFRDWELLPLARRWCRVFNRWTRLTSSYSVYIIDTLR